MSIAGAPTVIRVSIEQTQPLKGTAATEDTAPVAFDGWMEFLGVVSELLGLRRPRHGGTRAESMQGGRMTNTREDQVGRAV